MDMQSMSSLSKLMRYSRWACDRLYGAVLQGPKPTHAASGGGAHEKILDALGHIFIVDQIWKSHLIGVAHEFSKRRFEQTPDGTRLKIDQSAVNDWFVDYVDGLADDRCNDPIEFKFVSGTVGNMTRSDMLFHVINHRTYHWGSVTEMMRQAGYQRPSLDLCVYLTESLSGATP
jgi:uncharacterized damage-inducible protein DinB